MRRGLLALVVSLAAGSGMVACAKLSEFMAAHTYGPNFDYIPDEQVDSVMWQLARDVKRDRRAHAATPRGSTPRSATRLRGCS